MDWPPSPLKELSKAAWQKAARDLRAELLLLQHRLRDADFPVILVFGGVDGAGKHEMAHLLTEWLDPRFIRTLAYAHPARPELRVPPLLRYWQDLPAHGHTAIVLSGWYSPPLMARARNTIDEAEFRAQLADIAAFEDDLVADGALVLKFWMHLDAQAQRERLGDLMSDPHNVWQVSPRDWANLHLYDDFMSATTIVHETSAQSGHPWVTVDGRPRRARAVAVAQRIVKALQVRLSGVTVKSAPSKSMKKPVDRLSKVQYPVLRKPVYNELLLAAQAELNRHSRRLLMQGRGLVVVFEGWDAAGKGGAIRRMLQALDVRYVTVHRIAAPDAGELAHHYLWRFAKRFPGPGEIAIFDRSWYGRMLVERVEDLTPGERWQRAPVEIGHFERQWTAAGNVLIKFWLQITEDEQLARFENRRQDPLKEWKLTEEDWRNRDKWNAYEVAVNEMLQATNSPEAPWHVIGANDKRHARIAVLQAANAVLAAC